jgi:hypothetical protein
MTLYVNTRIQMDKNITTLFNLKNDKSRIGYT